MNNLLLRVTSVALFAALPVQAQLQWQPGEQASGPDSYGSFATCRRWDPDGAGPAGEVLVIGGRFEMPSLGTKNLVLFDPATQRWGAFPAVPDDIVTDIAVMANGELAITGLFTHIGEQLAHGIAIGDGATWTCPDGGFAEPSISRINAISATPSGDLIVGGTFSSIGTTSIASLARWDGSQWNEYPGTPGRVDALVLRQNGNLVVGGNFPGRVAEWDGNAWTLLLPTLGGPPAQLVELANGDLVAAGGVYGMAQWHGSGWTPLTAGGVSFGLIQNSFLAALPNGDLLANQIAIPQGAPLPFGGIGRWDGSQWTPVAPGVATTMHLLPDGTLWATGVFDQGAPQLIRGLASWDGTSWSPTSAGFDNTVRDLTERPDGRIVAIGDFHTAGGREVANLAELDGGVWRPLQAPPFPGGTPGHATIDATGELVVASGLQSWPTGVFRLTMQGWQQVGDILAATTDLLFDSNDLLASRAVYSPNGASVVRWNGATWQPLGDGLDGPVHVLLRRRNGELVAGGEFLFSGATGCSRIARWNGTTWQPFGVGFDGPVRALVERPDGELIAAGDFQNDGTLVRPLGLVARWDGVDWQPIGGGLAGAPGVSVRDLALLPDGDLLAGGDFMSAGGAPVVAFARFDGSQWSAVDGGVDGPAGANVETIVVTNDGRVAIGGDFATVDGAPSAHFASLRSDTPATAAPYGQGCAATAGPLVLTPTSLPWIGGSYRADTTTLANGALALEVFGFAAAQLALATVLPFAGAGCDLLATPDVLGFATVAAGRAESRLDLPNDPALLQAELRHQVLVLEAPGGALQLASSNAALLTIGGL